MSIWVVLELTCNLIVTVKNWFLIRKVTGARGNIENIMSNYGKENCNIPFCTPYISLGSNRYFKIERLSRSANKETRRLKDRFVLPNFVAPQHASSALSKS